MKRMCIVCIPSLGKGEAQGSIPCGSTRNPNKIGIPSIGHWPIRALPRRTEREHAVTCGTSESQQVRSAFPAHPLSRRAA